MGTVKGTTKPAAVAKAAATPVEKVKLTVSGILQDLSDGLDKKGIREKYGLSATDVKRLFENPKLKGRRVRKAAAFELTDDTGEVEEKVVAKAKPAPTKPVADKPKATVVQEEKEEEQVEEVNDDVDDTTEVSGQINEVAGGDEDDDIELDDKKQAPKKGLW